MNHNIIFPDQKPLGNLTVTQPTGDIKNKRTNFREVLKQTIDREQKLSFSQHARQRLEVRQISFTEQDLRKIENAVDKAKEKGIKDSLILMQNVALVVNVPNRTIITAIEGSGLKEKVFTNIDGAVIV